MEINLNNGASESDDDADIDSAALQPAGGKKRPRPKHMAGWLKQYALAQRKSTITGAFVAAVLPHDDYDETTANAAMSLLGQGDTPTCVYCGAVATTWDHLTSSVKNHRAHGPGHRIYNLVPCCAPCNSSKGGKSFEDWIMGYTNAAGIRKPATPRVLPENRENLVALLRRYQKECPTRSSVDLELEAKLMEMRDRVWAIFDEADELVAQARKPR
jgi:hypothetical protein